MSEFTLNEIIQGWRGGLKSLKLWNKEDEIAYKQMRKIHKVKKSAMLVTGEFVQRWKQNFINNLQTSESKDWDDLIADMLGELGIKIC